MKIILTYGTFDLFHYGHYNLLKRASEMGDKLIVGVSSDEMCKAKGKVPLLSQEKRMEIVSSLKFVDTVILEENMAQKVTDVVKFHANVFLLGDDYKDVFPKMPEYRQMLDCGCEVLFLPRTQDISTTELKKKMAEQENLNNTASAGTDTENS